MAECMVIMGQYQPAVDLLQTSCSVLRLALGQRHPWYVTAALELAKAYRGQGKYGDSWLLLA